MNQLSTNYYLEVAQAFLELEEELRTLLVNSSYYDFTGYRWPSMAAYQNKRNGHTRFTLDEVIAIVKAIPSLQEQLPLVYNYDRLRRRLGDDVLSMQIQLKLLFSKTPKQPTIIVSWEGPAVISYNQFLLRLLDHTLWTPGEISALSIRMAEYVQALINLVNPADEHIGEVNPQIHEQNRTRYDKAKKKSAH